jgi:hypothetical protein
MNVEVIRNGIKFIHQLSACIGKFGEVSASLLEPGIFSTVVLFVNERLGHFALILCHKRWCLCCR